MDIFKVVIDGVLGIMFLIDNIVYSFIPILYRLLLYLANIDLVTGNIPVQALIQRIYILVGVFMLFKLSFSVMSYIVDPDAFSDKSKGFSNLVKRVLIAIVLLVGIPWFFREAYEIQGRILTSGILPRLVLGEAMADNYDSLEETMETSATDVQFMLFGPFFSLNYKSESGDLIDCTPSQENPTSNVLGTNGMASNEACMNKVAELMDDPDSDVSASGVTLRDFFRYEENGIQDNRKFESFGGLISWTLSNGNRAIKYYPIASTLCGGYLVFLLLSFCIDAAARIIRMFFLQILSPIAVISSVDPTTNGDSLKEWAKECVKVWASLFLRLLVIFLIIQLVRIVSNTIYSGSIFENNGGDVNMWIYVFLILGIFQAAKSIPELIEKATGIKMSGDLQLNPFKALSENVGLQKGLGVATGVGIGAVGVATGAGVGRIFSGVYQGLRGKNALEVQKNMVEGNRTMRNARSDGSTFFGRVGARVTNLIGSQGALGRIEDQKVREENDINQLESEKLNIENNIRGVRDEITQRQAVSSAISKIKDRAYSKVTQGTEYQQSMARVEALRARAENASSESERMDFLRIARELEGETERWAHNEGAQAWLNTSGRNDAATFAAMQEYRTASEQAGLVSYDYDAGSELWGQDEDITRGVANATRLISGQEQDIKRIDQQIQDHQNEIKRIDQEHRRVESDYKAVGGQSGGTREKNSTDRSDAGQHYGSTNFFGPMGPPPGGGPGHRP